MSIVLHEILTVKTLLQKNIIFFNAKNNFFDTKTKK
jgi:hypothetical protein